MACVADGCWCMIRVAEEVFEEFLRVVPWTTSGFQDEREQVDTGPPVELFVLLSFGHEAWAGDTDRDGDRDLSTNWSSADRRRNKCGAPLTLKSRATKTQGQLASAKYGMDLIILLAPSWQPTPSRSGPATAMTDGFLAN